MNTTDHSSQTLETLAEKYRSIEAPKELYGDIIRAAARLHASKSPTWHLPLAASLAVLLAGFIGFQLGKNTEIAKPALVKNYPGMPTASASPSPPTMAYVSLPTPPVEIHPSIWKASGFSVPDTSADSHSKTTTRIN